MSIANPTMRDVLKRFYPDFREQHTVSAEQSKAAWHIMNCKTGAFGSNIARCARCGHIQYHHNSCRDRSCPMCQAISNELWADTQNEFLLDVEYYHVVLTCPQELYPLIYANQKELYSLFFRAASETLTELASSHIGGMPGFIAVLHTWGSDLSYHPHLHVLITGGGLGKDKTWHSGKPGYLFPGKAIAKLFRGKFLAGLRRIHNASRLVYYGWAKELEQEEAFQDLLKTCYGKQWVSDIRKSFAGAESVMRYLGRYTHRIAIGNSRILRMDDSSVTFRVKDYKNGGVWKEQTLSGVEFVRRFLMHIPPRHFVRVRHYGLLCSRNKNTLIPLCRQLLGCRKFLSKLKDLKKSAVIHRIYHKDVTVCPRCGAHMSLETIRSPRPLSNAPPP